MFERVRQELANGRGGAVDGIIPGEPAFFRSLLRLESVEWNTVPDSVLTAATMFLREGCPSWLAVSAERANRLQLARTAAPSAATTKTASARTRPTARQRLPAPTAPPAEVLPPSSPEVDMHDGSQAQSPPRSEEDDDSTVDEDEDQLAQDEGEQDDDTNRSESRTDYRDRSTDRRGRHTDRQVASARDAVPVGFESYRDPDFSPETESDCSTLVDGWCEVPKKSEDSKNCKYVRRNVKNSEFRFAKIMHGGSWNGLCRENTTRRTQNNYALEHLAPDEEQEHVYRSAANMVSLPRLPRPILSDLVPPPVRLLLPERCSTRLPVREGRRLLQALQQSGTEMSRCGSHARLSWKPYASRSLRGSRDAIGRRRRHIRRTCQPGSCRSRKHVRQSFWRASIFPKQIGDSPKGQYARADRIDRGRYHNRNR